MDALECPLTQSPDLEVPVNTNAVTTLSRIMNIEDISDEFLKARYQSHLSIIPEFHWMRAKIQLELNSELLDKFR